MSINSVEKKYLREELPNLDELVKYSIYLLIYLFIFAHLLFGSPYLIISECKKTKIKKLDDVKRQKKEKGHVASTPLRGNSKENKCDTPLKIVNRRKHL